MGQSSQVVNDKPQERNDLGGDLRSEKRIDLSAVASPSGAGLHRQTDQTALKPVTDRNERAGSGAGLLLQAGQQLNTNGAPNSVAPPEPAMLRGVGKSMPGTGGTPPVSEINAAKGNAGQIEANILKTSLQHDQARVENATNLRNLAKNLEGKIEYYTKNPSEFTDAKKLEIADLARETREKTRDFLENHSKEFDQIEYDKLAESLRKLERKTGAVEDLNKAADHLADLELDLNQGIRDTLSRQYERVSKIIGRAAAYDRSIAEVASGLAFGDSGRAVLSNNIPDNRTNEEPPAKGIGGSPGRFALSEEYCRKMAPASSNQVEKLNK